MLHPSRNGQPVMSRIFGGGGMAGGRTELAEGTQVDDDVPRLPV